MTMITLALMNDDEARRGEGHWILTPSSLCDPDILTVVADRVG